MNMLSGVPDNSRCRGGIGLNDGGDVTVEVSGCGTESVTDEVQQLACSTMYRLHCNWVSVTWRYNHCEQLLPPTSSTA